MMTSSAVIHLSHMHYRSMTYRDLAAIVSISKISATHFFSHFAVFSSLCNAPRIVRTSSNTRSALLRARRITTGTRAAHARCIVKNLGKYRRFYTSPCGARSCGQGLNSASDTSGATFNRLSNKSTIRSRDMLRTPKNFSFVSSKMRCCNRAHSASRAQSRALRHDARTMTTAAAGCVVRSSPRCCRRAPRRDESAVTPHDAVHTAARIRPHGTAR